MLAFKTCFRLSLVISSSSSPLVIYYSVLLWVMDNGLHRLLCCRGMYWLVFGGKTLCIKLQIISPVCSQNLVTWRKNICVISLQPTTGMSSLPLLWLSPPHLSMGLNMG